VNCELVFNQLRFKISVATETWLQQARQRTALLDSALFRGGEGNELIEGTRLVRDGEQG